MGEADQGTAERGGEAGRVGQVEEEKVATVNTLPGEEHLGECELCRDTFPIRELEIGAQVLCPKCRLNSTPSGCRPEDLNSNEAIAIDEDLLSILFAVQIGEKSCRKAASDIEKLFSERKPVDHNATIPTSA